MKKLAALMLAAALPAAATALKTVMVEESGDARVGRTAPSFGGWSIDGKKVITLDQLRRDRLPLLITFGASWCKPCSEGLPRLTALAKKHPEMKLVLVDVESDGDKAQEWAAKMGVGDGPAVLDKFEQIAKMYGLSGLQGATEGSTRTALPRTFLVDTRGKVRAIYREEGPDFEALIERELQALKAAVNASGDAK